MQETAGPTPIFDYMDFRTFLRERYAYRKKRNASFSYRYLAGKSGLGAGFLAQIMAGDRTLNPAMSLRLGKAFGLAADECDYFEALVLYCQGKSPAEKNLFLEKVLRLRTTRVRTLEGSQFDYFSAWYFSAVREFLNIYPFDGNYKKLAARIRPPIKPAEARKAVEVLTKLGIVEAKEDGIYRPAERLVSTGETFSAALVNNLHLTLGGLALRAVVEVPPAERNFSSLTMSISERGLETLKEKLKAFRKSVMEVVEQDSEVDRVYQMNFQVFPMTFPYRDHGTEPKS